MRFLVRHNRHHKVSRSSYVAKLLLFCEKLGLGGHYVMPIQFTRNLIMQVYWTTLTQLPENVFSGLRNLEWL